MKINKNTRISDLIKENEKSIDAIASLDKILEKLKNPILRKLMAARVTIEEAAKMGGKTLADFDRVLSPLGFEFEQNSTAACIDQEQKPGWLLTLPLDNIEIFDVREMLSQGNDPLKEIMKKFKMVAGGKALCIINTFVPTPLVRLLEKDNTVSYTETISAKEFHTYFFKQEAHPDMGGNALGKPAKSQVFTESGEIFDQNKARYGHDKLKEIDVRALEMPGPMQQILGELAMLPAHEALLVNHKRVPIYLLDELGDKGYQIHIFNVEEGNVKMLIEKIG